MNNLKFIISDTQYIKIIPESFDKDDCEVCIQFDIDYIDEEHNICIRFGYKQLSSFCYSIAQSGRIQKLIDGKMIFDQVTDLGFQCNRYFEGLIKHTDIIEKYHFVGNDHKRISPCFNSWLYNDKDGNIWFEITPFYPWHGTNKRSYPEKISYKEWIKDYKPTLKTMIPKENLLQWIEQAKELKKSLMHEHAES